MRQHLILNQSRLSTAEGLAKEIEDCWDATEKFSRDDKDHAGFIAPVGKGPAKGRKPNGVPNSFGKGSGTKDKEKCTEDSEFNPSVVNSESLVDTVIGVGESAIKKPSVGLNKSARRAIHLKTPLQRDIREWSNTSEKGQGHSQPKEKGKGKGKAKRKHPGKGKHNQDQRVEFVGDVQENDDFETPRLDRAACVFCVQKCKSVMLDSTGLPSSSTRVCGGSEEPAGTHEKFDQSTREVFVAVGCRDDRPIVDSGSVVSTCPMDHATSVPTEKLRYSIILESVLGDSLQHYGNKRNVPFTNRTGNTMNVNFDVTDTKRAFLSVHKGCGNGSMIVFTPDGKGKNVNDTKCVDQVKQNMASTPRFDIVYDRGAYVLDENVNDGVYVNDERRKVERATLESVFP